MFEKEAEENANQFIKTHSESDDFINCKRETDNYNVILAQGYELGFQKGAEFGYKKGFEDCAKARLNVTTISDCPIKDEWHYVKDEGTPKVEGHYLVCLRNKDRDVFDCWIYHDEDVGWYCMKVRMKDIYAWKEIVLPKEWL